MGAQEGREEISWEIAIEVGCELDADDRCALIAYASGINPPECYGAALSDLALRGPVEHAMSPKAARWAAWINGRFVDIGGQDLIDTMFATFPRPTDQFQAGIRCRSTDGADLDIAVEIAKRAARYCEARLFPGRPPREHGERKVWEGPIEVVGVRVERCTLRREVERVVFPCPGDAVAKATDGIGGDAPTDRDGSVGLAEGERRMDEFLGAQPSKVTVRGTFYRWIREGRTTQHPSLPEQILDLTCQRQESPPIAWPGRTADLPDGCEVDDIVEWVRLNRMIDDNVSPFLLCLTKGGATFMVRAAQ